MAPKPLYPPVHGRSNLAATPAVFGEASGPAVGVHGTSATSDGVLGEGPVGVYGRDMAGDGNGVIGYSKGGRGAWGHSDTGVGVLGESNAGAGVHGTSATNDGVLGEGPVGVYGRDVSGAGNGVVGYSDGGRGAWGHTKTGIGVLGESVNGIGVRGVSDSQVGVWGGSTDFEGMHAETSSTKTAALAAYQLNATSGTPAFYAKHAGSKTAALFEGNIIVTGDISLQNGDCAEDFDMAEGSVEPGSVMVLDAEGALRESFQPYDRCVAGVVAGAGTFKPGLVLDRHAGRTGRQPLALVGKTFCKVDAQFGAIRVGDLLTTSATPGCAMRVSDGANAFGSVIGKALRPLQEGRGLIPILVALQ